jgi:hypothetical protein
MNSWSSAWRLLCTALIVFGGALGAAQFASIPTYQILASSLLFAVAAGALAASLLLRGSRPDVSDVAAAAAFGGAAAVAITSDLPSLQFILTAAVATFAALRAVQSVSPEPESGRQWPSSAGWHSLFWVAVPFVAAFAFVTGVESASGRNEFSAKLRDLSLLGFAAVPLLARPPPSIRSAAGPAAAGVATGVMLVSLGSSSRWAAIVAATLALLTASLAIALFDGTEADQNARAPRRVARGILIGAAITVGVVVSVLIAPD